MAGLQYNFFPTDFFYPRQQQLRATDATHKPPLLSLENKSDSIVNDLDHHHQIVPSNNITNVRGGHGHGGGGYEIIKVPSPLHRSQNQASQLNSLSLLLFFPDQYPSSPSNTSAN